MRVDLRLSRTAPKDALRDIADISLPQLVLDVNDAIALDQAAEHLLDLGLTSDHGPRAKALIEKAIAAEQKALDLLNGLK